LATRAGISARGVPCRYQLTFVRSSGALTSFGGSGSCGTPDATPFLNSLMAWPRERDSSGSFLAPKKKTPRASAIQRSCGPNIACSFARDRYSAMPSAALGSLSIISDTFRGRDDSAGSGGVVFCARTRNGSRTDRGSFAEARRRWLRCVRLLLWGRERLSLGEFLPVLRVLAELRVVRGAE